MKGEKVDEINGRGRSRRTDGGRKICPWCAGGRRLSSNEAEMAGERTLRMKSKM